MTSALSPAAERIADSFEAAVAARRSYSQPYLHHMLENVFPADVAQALAELPFAPPVLNGVSGKRELHNDQRSYFDAAGVERFPVMRGVAEALQSTQVVRLVADAFELCVYGIKLCVDRVEPGLDPEDRQAGNCAIERHGRHNRNNLLVRHALPGYPIPRSGTGALRSVPTI